MATQRYGTFEWDKVKAHANVLKHEVAFEEAVTAFADPFAIDAPDRYIPGRFVLIGISSRNRILFVVYEERKNNLRRISARRARRFKGVNMKKGSMSHKPIPPEDALERYD